MRITGRLCTACVVAAGLLAGCAPATYPSATLPSSAPSSVTPTVAPSSTPTGVEATIRTVVVDYYAWANRVLNDPSVSVNEAAKYLIDVAPDNVMTAVEQRIVKFRSDGYQQTGTGTVTVESVAPASGDTYQARTCSDSSQIVVTDSKGTKVESSTPRAAALYTLMKGVDGLWRISRIEGVGTC
jgi:hypothetical protein